MAGLLTSAAVSTRTNRLSSCLSDKRGVLRQRYAYELRCDFRQRRKHGNAMARWVAGIANPTRMRDAYRTGAQGQAGTGPTRFAVAKREKPEWGEALIPLTVPEVRWLLYHLILWQSGPSAKSVLEWSRWRRRHQARARLCHYKAAHHLLATVVIRNYLKLGELLYGEIAVLRLHLHHNPPQSMGRGLLR